MRTSIVLDDRLIKEAMRLSKARSNREAVDLALRAYVAREKQRDVLTLIDCALIAPDYDVPRRPQANAARSSLRRRGSRGLTQPISTATKGTEGGFCAFCSYEVGAHFPRDPRSSMATSERICLVSFATEQRRQRPCRIAIRATQFADVEVVAQH